MNVLIQQNNKNFTKQKLPPETALLSPCLKQLSPQLDYPCRVLIAPHILIAQT